MAKYIRIPEALHEIVKDVAYRRRTHMESIAEDALLAYLDEPVRCRSCGNIANLAGEFPREVDKSPAQEENTANSELVAVWRKLTERIETLDTKRKGKPRKAGRKS